MSTKFPRNLSPKHLLKLLKSEKSTHSVLSFFDSATQMSNSRRKSFENGKELLDWLWREGFSLDMISFCSVNGGVCESWELVSALEVFDEMIIWKRMKRNERCKDLFTYSTFIHGLSESRDVDGASGIFREMTESGVHPDVVTYNAMLNGYCRFRRVDDSLELWELVGRRVVVILLAA
ncbi:Pentatricopeptide repeat [Dillenia turbinata]|uniref:Pentatricopeptide repeat n=1 Tax=Dillenia turbinata TaxID=194707 RepID=A0AAN8W8Y6_9MAGN